MFAPTALSGLGEDTLRVQAPFWELLRDHVLEAVTIFEPPRRAGHRASLQKATQALIAASSDVAATAPDCLLSVRDIPGQEPAR